MSLQVLLEAQLMSQFNAFPKIQDHLGSELPFEKHFQPPKSC